MALSVIDGFKIHGSPRPDATRDAWYVCQIKLSVAGDPVRDG